MTGHDGTHGASQLRHGELLPELSLVNAAGQPVNVRRFRQRQPVLVALLHSAACARCANWLQILRNSQDEVDDAHVATIIVRPDVGSPLGSPDSTLVELEDSTGDVLARWLPAPANGVGLVLADRYGRILRLWQAPDADGFPAMGAVLGEFAFAEQDDCACGLPVWPEETP